jgi:magnesium chelatase subunit I
MGDAVARLGVGESPAEVASAVEFLLEGLHLQRRLNKERQGASGGGRYRS